MSDPKIIIEKRDIPYPESKLIEERVMVKRRPG